MGYIKKDANIEGKVVKFIMCNNKQLMSRDLNLTQVNSLYIDKETGKIYFVTN